MDFFDHQEQARKKTRGLVFLFLFAVAGIIAAIYAVALLVFAQSGSSSAEGVISGAPFVWWMPDLFGGVAAGVAALVGIGSATKTMALRQGGEAVAQMLGGRLIAPDTIDFHERKLLNVVEEMAVASGIPAPPVYLMNEELGINAFAAGHRVENAAIGVTRGCMTILSRDELQGVIAHEFSHILNGDMRLNIRLIGILHGILLISTIGYGILRMSGRRRLYGGRRSNDDNKGAAAILLFGVALWLIGLIGVFCGRLIKSAVSRQREYLADSSAVQFTRNPDGIGGALKKMGDWPTDREWKMPMPKR